MWQYSHMLRASAHIQKSQEKLQDLLDNASDLIQSVDADGKFIYVNAAWRETLKYDEAEFSKLTVFDVIHPDWRDHCQAAFHKIINGESVNHIETVFLARDGTKVHVTGSVNCRMENGICVSTRGIFRDITTQHKALEHGRLATKVFESIQEAILVTDPEGMIKVVNAAFTAITGYLGADVIDKPVYEILRSGEAHLTDGYKLAMHPFHPKNWEGEIIGRRRNGEHFTMQVAISHIRDENDRVANYVGIFSDITERKRMEKRLEHLATHDFLTDLPNRALFQKRLEDAITTAEQDAAMFAVLFLDLDEFKAVNDTFGHDFGDHLIQSLASRVRDSVRKSDLVARMGGDEFAIILQYISDVSQAVYIAQKIIQHMESPFDIMGERVQVTMSIGISLYPKSQNARALLKDADLAMYQAKRDGKNTFRVF